MRGTRSKTVLTGIGPVSIEVPRDRDASFEPMMVNRPIYAVIGVSVNGERDILGLWAGDGCAEDTEGAKFWLAVLTEIKNRASRTCASPCATA